MYATSAERHETQTRINEVLALAEQARSVLQVAEGLLRARRAIDLTGFELQVGLICARALDLPPDQGRATRAQLMLLRIDLDQALEQLVCPG